MHKGRIYPYTPKYWATEGWFWPGFVPWKMDGEILVPGIVWNPYVSAQILGPSNPSTVALNGKSVRYSWNLSPPDIATSIAVSLSKQHYTQGDYCRWQIVLTQGAVVLDRVYQFQPFPQYSVFTTSDLWTNVDNPDGVTGGPQVLFGPSNYADGGSPWS